MSFWVFIAKPKNEQADNDQNKTEKGFFKVGEWFLDYHQLKKGNDQKYRQKIQEGLEKFEE